MIINFKFEKQFIELSNGFRAFENGVLQFDMYDCQNQFFPLISGTHISDTAGKKCLFPQENFPQYLVSPGIISTGLKPLDFYSPSPFKKPCFANIDQGNFPQLKVQQQENVKKPQLISHIINLNESPKLQRREMQVKSEPQTSKIQRQTRKNCKGLRCLSESVYQIVLQLKSTTYKQVANRLVAALYERGQSESSLFRDQQNIKRRVYDALNVLISAGILQKNGKQVLSDNRAIPQKMRKHEVIAQRQAILRLQQQVQEKHLSLSEKKQKFEELHRKNQIMKEILKRNRKKKFQNKEKIFFPLVGVVFEPFKDSTVQLKNQNNELKMQMNSLQSITGDIDLMMNIDMASHNVDQIMSDQIFEEEIYQIAEKKKFKNSKFNK